MKAYYDSEANGLYIYTGNKNPVYFTAQEKDFYIDYDEEGNVIGYEFILSDGLEIDAQ